MNPDVLWSERAMLAIDQAGRRSRRRADFGGGGAGGLQPSFVGLCAARSGHPELASSEAAGKQ